MSPASSSAGALPRPSVRPSVPRVMAGSETDAPSAAEGTVTNNDLLYPFAFCSRGMKVRRKADLLKRKQTAKMLMVIPLPLKIPVILKATLNYLLSNENSHVIC